jgi:hypothetical protein
MSFRKLLFGAALLGLAAIALPTWLPKMGTLGPVLDAMGLDDVLEKVGEALLIAAFLAATVDLFVKDRLVREVVRDVSSAIRGADLPKDLRDEYSAICDTRVFRESLELEYELQWLPSNKDFVQLTAMSTFRMQNYANSPQPYAHVVSVQKPFRPMKPFAQITVVGAVGVLDEKHKAIEYALEAKDDKDLGTDNETGTESVWQRNVMIPPTRDRQPSNLPRLWCTTVQVFPRDHSDIFFSVLPTIGKRIKVRHPPELSVQVEFGHRLAHLADKRQAGTWSLPVGFVGNSILMIEWRSRPTPPALASDEGTTPAGLAAEASIMIEAEVTDGEPDRQVLS